MKINRLSFWCLAILLCVSTSWARMKIPEVPVKIIRQSQPIVSSGLQFVVVTEAEWKGFRNVSLPVDIQLQITNTTDREILFSTYDTFASKLKTRTELPCRSAEAGTRPSTHPRF